MNLGAEEISLAHVHAYVDAQLSDADCQRLEDYFDVNPDKFAQLQQFLAINDHFQSLYDTALSEPIPQSMFDRVYEDNHDPFCSAERGIPQISKKLSSVLLEKSDTVRAGLGQRLYSFLRINRLKNIPWFIRLQSLVSNEKEPQQTATTNNVEAPTLYPAWIRQPLRHTFVLLTRIKSSIRNMNLFAAAGITAVGITVGVVLHNSPDTAIVEPVNQGYAQSQAIQAHLFYRKEGQSFLEENRDKQQQLLSWVSGRLGKEIRLIDFSEMGYSNTGMMLVPAVDNFAMVTVYENNQGQRITLYVGLRNAEKTAGTQCVARESTKSLCHWANDTLQFVVVSDLVVDETRQLAEWMMQNYAMAHLISSNVYFFSQTLGTINA